ncbi:mediator complex subunit 27 [Temnothorax americanus]|uniref:Mediator of RNA polymerase II transcription subunit 27 n=2 Tax=Temnothorax TaxID=300110 RepID=A0A6J1Q985_9HYME|nr:mediator of RNA polymerase II transcription subunit 27 [Temnothorax curvispinosus]XP_024878802.1 mediator of RNA polymerase II transcription subunit 27 [Temnothorax curvispinosus]XP_024878803.1 mediator of RNA polymerase II transcription subunit 27 [Temnothorax curvispinosus]XP_024878804.1 mediator of RNA polymerase II transcription subunit 27 [Temnothorax curvispinosus]
MEQLQTALTAIKVLRSNVGQVFDSLGNGLRAEHGEENKESKYLFELQELLTTVNLNLRDVEQAISSLNPPPGPFNLASTTYLSQETTQERQALYSTLVNSYKWTDKIHEYSNVAHNLLSHSQLKRSYMILSRTKRGRYHSSCHNVPQTQVDSLISTFDRTFSDMTVTVTRPSASSNAILHLTLGHVLKGMVVFKGVMIERVVIKGYGEPIDLWSESRHKVFRKATENAHAAMLHFYSPTLPDLAVRSFMTWFHSLITLFSDPCKRCGLHLHSAFPPTWRDFRTLDPYHQECKP